MKKLLSSLAALFILAFFLTNIAEAQFVVKVRPTPPLIVARPPIPSPKHVWINGDYVWRGGRYIYIDGYWATPPARRHHWVDGHWKHTRRGWTWVPGRWR